MRQTWIFVVWDLCEIGEDSFKGPSPQSISSARLLTQPIHRIADSEMKKFPVTIRYQFYLWC